MKKGKKKQILKMTNWKSLKVKTETNCVKVSRWQSRKQSYQLLTCWQIIGFFLSLFFKSIFIEFLGERKYTLTFRLIYNSDRVKFMFQSCL